MAKIIPIAAKEAQRRIDLIEELAPLERKAQEYAPFERRRKAIKDEIRGWAADVPAKESITFEGSAHAVTLAPRETERKINLPKLYRRLKMAKFLEFCSFTLKALDAVVPKSEQAGLVTEARTGTRDVILTAKPQPIAAEKKAA